MKQLGKNQVWIGTEPLESLVIYFFFTETEDKSPLGNHCDSYLGLGRQWIQTFVAVCIFSLSVMTWT
jgi:hypothetical protein